MTTLSYRSMHETQPGYYETSESTTLATAFENEDDALYTFKDYLTDPSGGGYTDATDVTETEGFQGWGRVFRANDEDGNTHLYSVTIN